MMSERLLKRLQRIEAMQSDGVPWARVTFQDGHCEKWDLSRISQAFLGDGAGICRVEWLRPQTGILLQLFTDEEYWRELREVRRSEN